MRNRPVLLCIAVCTLLVSAAFPALGQDPVRPSTAVAVPADVVAPGPPYAGWTAEATVGHDRYVSDNAIWRPWSAAELLVARQFRGGSIGVGVMEVERFERRDGAVSVDVYRALWTGAHGNVRAQLAREGVVLPTTDVSAELYQALPDGWEPSFGVRRLGYEDAVLLTSLAIGKYVGDRWYGRLRGAHAGRSGSTGFSASGLVRRYLGSTREYMELVGGTGKEALTAGVTSTDEVVVDIRQVGFLEVGGRRYVTRHVGGTVAASYHTFEAIPGRVGVRFGVLARY